MITFTSDPVASIRPEAELLLCCAQTCMDSAKAERIKALLREDVDWAYLIRIAAWHGVMPLLYWNLNNICPELVPKTTLSQLRDFFCANTRRNLFLTGELVKLLRLFEVHEIPAIPYKGPVLAALVYGNLSLRQFNDLDILVQRRDVPRARDLLILQGFRLKIHLADAQEATSPQSEYHDRFLRDDGGLIVELHWGITWKRFPFSSDKEHLWEHLELVSLAGATVPNFLPEELLLFLCVHGSKHGPFPWFRLKWVCDVAELIRVQQGMNWKRVMEKASRLGTERMTLLGLLLVNYLLDTTLPEEVLQRLQTDPVVKSLATRVCERLFSEADGPLLGLEKHLFYVRMRERLRDRVPYFLYLAGHKITPNETDRTLLPLPTFLSFLYYLLRPLRLVGEYGLNRLKGLKGI